MPRGFLIKRKKHQAYSWRHYIHLNSEDDRSECGSSSDPDANQQSPEPGIQDKKEGSESVETSTVTKRHYSKEWLLRTKHELKVDDRPSSAESSDTENKNTLPPERDANGNSISKATPDLDHHLHLLKEVDDVHEYNNNNNNREPLSLYNKNFNLNRYGFYHPANSMPGSPTGRAANLSVNTSLYGSPFYWTFNRLALSSPKQQARSALSSPASVSSLGSRRDSIQSISPKSTPSPGKRKANQTPDSGKVKVIKRPKSARKISFEEELKSSPVSGTYIKGDVDDVAEEEGIRVVSGDIDSSMNCVEITPEAEAELAKIDNKIGDFICKLCKEFFENAFALAQHRCSRIVHVEYKCPECDKVFNCPANLASHRRWHKPRPQANNNNNTSKTNQNNSKNMGEEMNDTKGDNSRNNLKNGAPINEEGLFACEQCGKKFRRQAYLKKHQACHSLEQPPVTSYPCFYCNKPFKSETSRSKHMLQSHTPDAKGPSCRFCNAVFPETLSLEQHVRCHHNSASGTSNVDPFSCKFCPSSFFSMYGLSRHMYKCHPSETRQAMTLQLPPPSHQSLTRPC